MDSVRLRVVFEDRHILTKPQRSEGLKRIWLLLKPQHETVSDLSSYLAQIFDLQRSCPNGIILFMDGFVLPPFESTCILKDKDIIRVKRRELSSEIVNVDNGENSTEEEVVVRQPVSVPLLENRGFEEENGGCHSQPKEDEDRQSDEALHVDSSGKNAASKKRKASHKLQSSKKKRKQSVVPQDTENDLHKEHNENSHIGGLHHGKRIEKREKRSDVKRKANRANSTGSAETNDDIGEPLPSSKRSIMVEENDNECINVPQRPDGSKKVPSRSARRKKAKRQWLRELAKAEKEKLEQRQSPEEDMPTNSIQHEEQIHNHKQQNDNTEAGDDVAVDHEMVPIVIRPGHIRFEPLTNDLAAQQSQASIHLEMFQRNGITTKKKGQKWGKENLPSRKRDNYNFDKGCVDDVMTIEEVTLPSDPIDFNKLAPFIGLPKEGDVIAYRLLELSSTWTPELSSFRVGKTSWYDPESNKVLLQPVPEYPISFEKKLDEDEGAQEPDNSLYREDGSLEIDFSTLADVRFVKYIEADPSKAAITRVNDTSLSSEANVSNFTQHNNGKGTPAPAPEKEVNAWEEISQALSAKKAELLQEKGWSRENSAPRSWSYRALRGTAMGPTMALLRARNDI